MIDPHVHCRWTEYPEDYLGLAHRDAWSVGLGAIMEMGNTNPPLTSMEAIKKREQLANDYDVRSGVRHYLTPVVTPQSLPEVISAVKQWGELIRAVKVFWSGSSIGRETLGVTDPNEQKRIWDGLLSWHYRGVVMQHCEDPSLWMGDFDWTRPFSHSLRQSAASETMSVETQLRNAYDAGFEGVFYVCHVSSSDTVELVRWARRLMGHRMRIVMEATWHHIFLNWDDYAEHGNRLRCNPPLRSSVQQEALLSAVIKGDIDLIGSDHAPHPLSRKDVSNNDVACGLPTLPFWPRGVQLLRALGVPEDRIEELTGDTAAALFGIENRGVIGPYDPSLWEAYGWNPFRRLS